VRSYKLSLRCKQLLTSVVREIRTLRGGRALLATRCASRLGNAGGIRMRGNGSYNHLVASGQTSLSMPTLLE
jgi:hypothetical protein